MSQNRPPKKQSVRKPEYKIRPGFTEGELEDWKAFVISTGMDVGALARRILLDATRKVEPVKASEVHP